MLSNNIWSYEQTRKYTRNPKKLVRYDIGLDDYESRLFVQKIVILKDCVNFIRAYANSFYNDEDCIYVL